MENTHFICHPGILITRFFCVHVNAVCTIDRILLVNGILKSKCQKHSINDGNDLIILIPESDKCQTSVPVLWLCLQWTEEGIVCSKISTDILLQSPEKVFITREENVWGIQSRQQIHSVWRHLIHATQELLVIFLLLRSTLPTVCLFLVGSLNTGATPSKPSTALTALLRVLRSPAAHTWLCPDLPAAASEAETNDGHCPDSSSETWSDAPTPLMTLWAPAETQHKHTSSAHNVLAC